MKQIYLTTLSLLFAAACSSGPAQNKPIDNKKDTPNLPKETPAEPITLTLWHTYRDAEKDALEEVVADWNATDAGKKSPVKLEANPYDGFADKLSTAIPRGNGPDLFIFAHDRVGGWAKSKLVEPLQEYLDDKTVAELLPETLPPLEFQEQFYGLPLAYKSAVLFYNTELVPIPPTTTDDMIAMAKSLTNTKDGVFGLIYPHSTLFHHSPWLFGYGGKLLDGEKPMLTSAENAKSIAFVKGMVDAGIMPKEVTAADLASFFNGKKAAMVINGPWFRGEIKSDIKYAVASLPMVSETNQPAKPFLSVEAIMLSAEGKHKKEAFAFARFVAIEDASKRLTKGKQSVAAKAPYETPEAKIDPILQVFAAQLKNSTPTPNIPAMNAIWSPFDGALEAAISGQKDPATALTDAQTKAEGK
jgi:arabinogalactan oligomer/maltooligosaccharide transport system substrate-binding protein